MDKIIRTIVRSPAPGCYNGCGVKLYIIDDNLIKVEGDENHHWNQVKACPREDYYYANH